VVEILTMDTCEDDDASQICEGNDDSLTRNHELFLHSYEQASHLLKDFDRTTAEWLFELKNELQIMPIVGQLSNMSIFEETNVFLNLLDSVSVNCVDHSVEIESEQRAVDEGDVFAFDRGIDFEGSDANSESDSNSQRQQGFSQYFLDVMDNVNHAKERLASRFNKMKQSFNHLKDVQKSTVERSIGKFKRDTGFDKLEQQLEENDYQLLKFQTMLKERRRLVEEHKQAHRDLTIQEIRAKFEGELQEKIKQLILQVERKTNELHDLEVSHGILKQSIAKLNIDLSVLLLDVEAEERRNFVDMKQQEALSLAAATMSSEPPYSAGVEEDNSDSSSTGYHPSAYTSGGSVPFKYRDVHAVLFNTDSNGIITEEHLSDSKSVLSQVADEQARLSELIAVMEERNMKLTRKLRDLPRSDESRGIDRLKKRIVELESNLKANEDRYKVMSKLHFRVKDDQRSRKESSSIAEEAASNPAKAKNSKPAVMKVGPSKQRTIRSKYLDHTNPEELHSRVKELLDLLKSSGETMSDITHRHVYAAYFVDDSANHNKKMDFAKDALRSVTVGYPSVDGMPKKRRITKKDSLKIKAIADRIALHRSRYLSRNQTALSHAIIEYPPGGITIAPTSSRSDSPSKDKSSPLLHGTGSSHSKSTLCNTNASAIENEKENDENGPTHTSTTAPQETDENSCNNPKKLLSDGRFEYPNVPPSNVPLSRSSFSLFWNDFDDGMDTLHQTAATAAASQRDADDEEMEKPHSVAAYQTAASTILRNNRVEPRSIRQIIAQPTRGSDVDYNDRQQFNEASISTGEEDSDREFYSQNYGIYSALEQAQAMLKELTTVKVDKTLDVVKDVDDEAVTPVTSKHLVGSAVNLPNNSRHNEYKSVESLQQSSELYVKKISEVHFKSKHIDTIRKTLKIKLQNVMKAEIKARIRLCAEIEGSNWSIATLPGLYQADIEDCKARIEHVKDLCKNAEYGLSVKRKETRRISQAFIQRTSLAGMKAPPPLPPRPTVHRDRAITTIEDDAAEDDDTAYTDSVNTESSSDSNKYGDGVGDDVMRNDSDVIPDYLFVDYDADDSDGDD